MGQRVGDVLFIPFPVSSTGTETRQFYDLYNSSVDERDFMEKEVCVHILLVTCFFTRGMSSDTDTCLILCPLQFKIVSSIHENFDA